MSKIQRLIREWIKVRLLIMTSFPFLFGEWSVGSNILRKQRNSALTVLFFFQLLWPKRAK